MKIYLDLCVYKRPFDYQGQERIALETNMFIYLLERIEAGIYRLVVSDVLVYENSEDPNIERRDRVISYFHLASKFVEVDEASTERAIILEELGFAAIDALHIAVAEKAGVDCFITCDDDIVRVYRSVKDKVSVLIKSLREFIAQEVE